MYFIEAGEVQVIITVEDVNQVTAAWTDGSRTAVLAAQGSHRGRCEGRTRLTCSCHPESYVASFLRVLQVVASLSSGEFFGEIALLHQQGTGLALHSHNLENNRNGAILQQFCTPYVHPAPCPDGTSTREIPCSSMRHWHDPV